MNLAPSTAMVLFKYHTTQPILHLVGCFRLAWLVPIQMQTLCARHLQTAHACVAFPGREQDNQLRGGYPSANDNGHAGHARRLGGRGSDMRRLVQRLRRMRGAAGGEDWKRSRGSLLVSNGCDRGEQRAGKGAWANLRVEFWCFGEKIRLHMAHRYILEWGCPKKSLSDNGLQFSGSLSVIISTLFGIHGIFTI